MRLREGIKKTEYFVNLIILKKNIFLKVKGASHQALFLTTLSSMDSRKLTEEIKSLTQTLTQ